MIALAGEERVGVARNQLWALLSDPPQLARALPNVSDLHVVGPDRFTATIAPDVAPGRTPVRMTFRLRERHPPATLAIEGSAVQAGLAIELIAELKLETDDQATVVHWRTQARFLGPLGAVGQRVLPEIVRSQVSDALQAAGRLAAFSETA